MKNDLCVADKYPRGLSLAQDEYPAQRVNILRSGMAQDEYPAQRVFFFKSEIHEFLK